MPDILVRGMEMPKHCIDCPCMVDKYGGDNCCLQSEEANAKIESWDDMKSGCPLVELPPHGDLIDRDEYVKSECNNCDGSCECVECDCLNCEQSCRCDVIVDAMEAPVVVPAEREGE